MWTNVQFWYISSRFEKLIFLGLNGANNAIYGYGDYDTIQLANLKYPIYNPKKRAGTANQKKYSGVLDAFLWGLNCTNLYYSVGRLVP